MKSQYPEFKLHPQTGPVKARAPTEAELSEQQHEKITNLCNLYGLNEEETRQLIDQLKAGGNISIEQPQPTVERRQSSIVSIKNEELSFNDSEFRFDEQYSFKQHQRRISISSNGGEQQQQFEKVLAARLRHDDDYIQRLRSENQSLKNEKADLAGKLTILMKMKEQETDIMLGLKNTICSLTALLSDKESAYSQLQQDYARLAEKFQRVDARKSIQDKENWQQGQPQQSQPRNSKLEKKQSRENLLTEVSLKDSNIQRKQSKQFSKNRSTTNFHAANTANTGSSVAPTRAVPPINTGSLNGPTGQQYIENLRQQQKQDSSKQQSVNRKQKIDISKYKVFIDELRNICINKQK